MLKPEQHWIIGTAQTGKTTQLVAHFAHLHADPISPQQPFLVFAANSDTRSDLVNRLATATGGYQPVRVYTPIGFYQDEITLFWPLVLEQLQLKSQFPLILRSENEQFLASRLWQPELQDLTWAWSGLTEAKVVRRILDLQQLASVAGLNADQTADCLNQGLPELSSFGRSQIQQCLRRWRQWGLDHALLSYSILISVYTHHVFPHPQYQAQLLKRFSGLLADDVDEYPAVIKPLFELFLQRQRPCFMSWNPDGSVRLGLGADPELMSNLAQPCKLQDCTTASGLITDLGEFAIAALEDPLGMPSLPNSMVAIQEVTRAQLLRRIAQVIIQSVQEGLVKPQDIAVIAPGLDDIARYVLQEILTKAGIGVMLLNEQRPLISVPMIRVLLTLLTFVYPGLGRLLDRDRVAEMLTILKPAIDPVRAGLIADHCFEPHPETPTLLPTTVFPRWDRLGYQATEAYQELLTWIDTQKQQLQQRLLTSVTVLFDRAIQSFFWSRGTLSADQLAALRELLEATQRFWEVEERLHPKETDVATLTAFIQLLQAGTITANPYPVKPWVPQIQPITIATVFQYRSSRLKHRWQFWLDASSQRWLTGTDALYRAEIFLQEQQGQPWTAEELLNRQEERLRRILKDLLSRTGERVFLCHSDLSTNGQEQMGPLLPLINAAIPLQDANWAQAVR
jgi:hypothetical protein